MRTFRVTCKDGSEKVIRFTPVSLQIEDQFVIYEDLTEQKKLEAQFLQAQKMEAIGRLAGGVAHDFNNLLTTILGYSDLVLLRIMEDDVLRQDIEEIKKAGKRAASLTRQLLAFSRKQVLEFKVFSLNTLITDLKKMLERLIGENVRVTTILQSNLGLIEADPGQIEQVIMNLVVNARDAMPKGGKLTIETANVDLTEIYGREHGIDLQSGPYVILSVSDTGIGMDQETRSRIFEPFFTTKDEGKGTGLGLATVYGIIKQSGGYIYAYSEPGQGTTFKIYLLRARRKTEKIQEAQIHPDQGTVSETVLVVEDNHSLRTLTRTILAQYGYVILEAESGEKALSVSNQYQGPIHLVLTDVVMPEMNGHDLAERLQSLRPNIKVLYMSGYADNAIIHHGILASEVNFIGKPFSPESLARKVRDVLDTP